MAASGRMVRLGILVILGVALMGGAGGCGLSPAQRAAIGKFSASTIAVADLASKEIAETRADVIDLRQRMLLLGETSVLAEDSEFDRDGAMDREDAQRRVANCTALKTFAELLSTMATSSRTEELAAATGACLTSLRKIKGVSLSDEKAGAIGQLVISIGGMIIDARRAQVVRKVVLETRGPVKTALRLLRDDLDVDDQQWMGTVRKTNDVIQSDTSMIVECINDAVAKNEEAKKEAADQKAKDAEANEKAKDAEANEKAKDAEADEKSKDTVPSDAEIALMKADYEKLKLDSAKVLEDYRALLPDILGALDEMAVAHQELCYVIQNREIIAGGEIDEFMAAVGKLIESVNVIRAKKHE